MPADGRSGCPRHPTARSRCGIAKLFEGEASGLLVRLPGWMYPVVLDTATGRVRYDNYGGAWGEQEHLNKFLQSYAVEKACLEARKRGHSVTEQALDDGRVDAPRTGRRQHSDRPHPAVSRATASGRTIASSCRRWRVARSARISTGPPAGCLQAWPLEVPWSATVFRPARSHPWALWRAHRRWLGRGAGAVLPALRPTNVPRLGV